MCWRTLHILFYYLTLLFKVQTYLFLLLTERIKVLFLLFLTCVKDNSIMSYKHSTTQVIHSQRWLERVNHAM